MMPRCSGVDLILLDSICELQLLLVVLEEEEEVGVKGIVGCIYTSQAGRYTTHILFLLLLLLIHSKIQCVDYNFFFFLFQGDDYIHIMVGAISVHDIIGPCSQQFYIVFPLDECNGCFHLKFYKNCR